MSRRKIGIFLPNLKGGGAERAMLYLSWALSKQIEVDLVLMRSEGPYYKEANDLGVRIIDLKAPRYRYALPYFSHYLVQHRPMVVISALENANVMAVMARLILKKEKTLGLILTEHTLPQHYQKSASPWWQSFPKWGGLFYRRADRVVGVSSMVSEALVNVFKVPPAKVRTIANPAIPPFIWEKAAEEIAHPFFTEKHPLVLSAGRLDIEKDFGTLIRAFALVRKRLPARMLILGEGEERANLQSLIRELGLEGDVDLPGFVPNPYAYIAHASVFVLSSRWEGSPLVLAEAMALGIPVVATDCGGPSEILRGGRWGKLVPIGDPEALAQAIIEQISAPLRPPPEAWLDFATEHVAEKYWALLSEVLEEKASRTGRKLQ